MPPLVIAFDAQVEPDVYLGGGYFVYDPHNSRKYGAWCQLGGTELLILGTSMLEIASGGQPIARCELAMLPILLHHEQSSIAGRDMIWMVDNTAALAGVIKGSTGPAVSEHLIASF